LVRPAKVVAETPLDRLRPGYRAVAIRGHGKQIAFDGECDTLFGHKSRLAVGGFQLAGGDRLLIHLIDTTSGSRRPVEMHEHPLSACDIQWRPIAGPFGVGGKAEPDEPAAVPREVEVRMPTSEEEGAAGRPDLTPDPVQKSRVGACLQCDKLFVDWSMEHGRPMCPACGRGLDVSLRDHCSPDWLRKLVE
jgi:hypothetical protein